MTFTDKLNYVTDFKEENKNSRRKKKPGCGDRAPLRKQAVRNKPPSQTLV